MVCSFNAPIGVCAFGFLYFWTITNLSSQKEKNISHKKKITYLFCVALKKGGIFHPCFIRQGGVQVNKKWKRMEVYCVPLPFVHSALLSQNPWPQILWNYGPTSNFQFRSFHWPTMVNNKIMGEILESWGVCVDVRTLNSQFWARVLVLTTRRPHEWWQIAVHKTQLKLTNNFGLFVCLFVWQGFIINKINYLLKNKIKAIGQMGGYQIGVKCELHTPEADKWNKLKNWQIGMVVLVHIRWLLQ